MEEWPNDRKLSDTPERRDTCMVGGKAVVEAGAVTRRRVRCSAWLGVGVVVWEDDWRTMAKTVDDGDAKSNKLPPVVEARNQEATEPDLNTWTEDGRTHE